ncbi:hypothetical protein FIM45_05830 [Helicobacter pylori]|uniref:hypothetical protein n=1 Tax=Helicobacter pylori TaxID=210 RepID=UPI00112742AB|nr:hypothetical protein [Helicobacter pylori]TPH93645.1 hypothetical protein FIM45_05830 [Helicobacter pylori]
MWNERFLKVIPAVAFLFCILEIFELFLIVSIMNKTEKLEIEIIQNVKVLEGMGLQHFEHKKNKIK